MSKSRDKRIKVTGTGKKLVRKPGVCHFNAKQSSKKRRQTGKLQEVKIKI